MGADSLYVGHYANCFLINGLTKGDWVEALMFAIATAVGDTRNIPMIVTTNLVKGSREMAKRRHDYEKCQFQNFGGMDVLCTDKTGTLTQDKSNFRIPL